MDKSKQNIILPRVVAVFNITKNTLLPKSEREAVDRGTQPDLKINLWRLEFVVHLSLQQMNRKQIIKL